VHPVKKQIMLTNEITSYGAAMNVLMAYYHMEDDWQDERKVSSLTVKTMLRGKVKKIMEQYPRQSRAIESALNELSVCEREGSTDLDKTAGCFGKLMEELFLYKKDRWEETLRKMGFFMGKFIYLMDAYEDLPNDLEKGCYNPLKKIAEEEGYEERIKQILCMMIAESTAEFEKLPCLSDIDILRNILYDGVWNCYNKIQRKKSEEQKK
jgi:predicted DNA-binding antitoxin AbrB/MazE fold protein